MPAINDKDIGNYQSEILFLLIGENPLPNYVAAKLLSKTSNNQDDKNPILVLIHSVQTVPYMKNLQNVLGEKNFQYFPLLVEPTDYFNIEEKITEQLKNVASHISIGLNYTGGTKAMAVHSYQAIKKLRQNGKFSYLDATTKFMRFDETKPGEGQNWIDIADVNSKPFEMTKISLDQLLALHGWEMNNTPSESITNPKENLTLENIKKAVKDSSVEKKDKLFEEFVLNTVISLKSECKLDSVCANLEIANPFINTTDNYCEIDVLAIRGYQLFAISCTITQTDFQEIRDVVYPNCVDKIEKEKMKSIFKQLRNESKHLLTHKLFEIALRAGQLGGAEARIGFISFANNDLTKNLDNKLKGEKNIKVWGETELETLTPKLRKWFNGK